MANTQTTAFITQFEDEIKIAYQQRQSLLAGTVFKRSVEGSTVKFPYLGVVETTTKVRNADVVPVDADHLNATATMEDFYAPIYLDSLDEVKTNQDLRRAYVDATVSAVNRKLDKIIITAMTLGTRTLPAPHAVAGAWTKARHLAAVQMLAEAEVDQEDRYMLINPAMLTAIYNIPEFTNHDYTSLSPAENGKIGMLFGINVIVSNLLPAVSNVTQAIYYNKRAVGLGVNAELKTEVNYIPQKVSTLVNTFGSAGAVIIDPAGVIEVAVS